MSPDDKEVKALRKRVDSLREDFGSLSADIQNSSASVKRLESLHAQATWMQRNPVLVWLLSFCLPLVALFATLFFGLLPRLEDYAKLQINASVAAGLVGQNTRIDKIAGDVADVRGDLKAFYPMLQSYLRDQMKKSATLSPEEFKSSLPQLSKTVAAVSQSKVQIDPVVVAQVGNRVFKLAGSQPNTALAWQTATALLSYRSSLNPGPLPPGFETQLHGLTLYYADAPDGEPRAQMLHYGDVPRDQSAVFEPLGRNLNGNNPRGDAFLIVRNGVVLLDNMDVKNVIFENMHIVYKGAKLRMDNAYFVNCTFDLPQTHAGEEFGLAVLDHPSVEFSIG
jgi:hypothetical protein